MPLEVVDIVVTGLPDVLLGLPAGDALVGEDGGMNLHDQDLLEVGAIEDADAASFGQGLGVAPEKIVVKLFRGRMLERNDLAALRIDARHDVLDGAVLAGRI